MVARQQRAAGLTLAFRGQICEIQREPYPTLVLRMESFVITEYPIISVIDPRWIIELIVFVMLFTYRADTSQI